jgi:hypothetical protein
MKCLPQQKYLFFAMPLGPSLLELFGNVSYIPQLSFGAWKNLFRANEVAQIQLPHC